MHQRITPPFSNLNRNLCDGLIEVWKKGLDKITEQNKQTYETLVRMGLIVWDDNRAEVRLPSPLSRAVFLSKLFRIDRPQHDNFDHITDFMSKFLRRILLQRLLKTESYTTDGSISESLWQVCYIT